MLPDRVSNPGPLTYESGALPIALRGPARAMGVQTLHPSVGNGTIEAKIAIKYKFIFMASCLSNCFCLNTNLKGCGSH